MDNEHITGGGGNSEVAYDGTNLPMMVGQAIDTNPHIMSWTWTPSSIAVRYDGSSPAGGHGYQVHIGPMYSNSRGSVQITSRDPKVKPKRLR